MEIVRTEPMDLAPVIQLPLRLEGNRVIVPVDAAPGRWLPATAAGATRQAPGRLARALIDLQTSRGRSTHARP